MAKQLTITLADGHFWYCDECETYSEESGGNQYECSECGETFTRATSANDNHQCPDCMKFGARTGEQGCIECGEAAVEQREAVQCMGCDEIVDAWVVDEDGDCADCAADADETAETAETADSSDGEATADKVKRLWAEGNASSEIAEAVGLPTQVVRTMVY